jgi:hypothetical protein
VLDLAGPHFELEHLVLVLPGSAARHAAGPAAPRTARHPGHLGHAWTLRAAVAPRTSGARAAALPAFPAVRRPHPVGPPAIAPLPLAFEPPAVVQELTFELLDAAAKRLDARVSGAGLVGERGKRDQ